MSDLEVIVVSGAGTDKCKRTTLYLDKYCTVLDLKRKYAKEVKKDINRLSFKYELQTPVRLSDDSKTVVSYIAPALTKELTGKCESKGPPSKFELTFKDLGPQIGYRTVFVLEYLGPMVFVCLWALRPSFLFGTEAAQQPYNWVAMLGIICWNIHFLKRELETFFVHKFSRPTMPLQNLFKNCTYYWTFGAFIGYPLASTGFVPPSETQVYIGLGIFVISEIGNLICHLMLSNMRPKEGSQKRSIPTGFLFNYVACPNYTFEVMAWVGFSVMTSILASYLFTIVGGLQMADWAMKKHKEYKKSYGKEYTNLRRKAIVPFIY